MTATGSQQAEPTPNQSLGAWLGNAGRNKNRDPDGPGGWGDPQPPASGTANASGTINASGTAIASDTINASGKANPTTPKR